MTKLGFILMLAQNGLKTASTFLHSKAQAEKAKGDLEASKNSEALADVLDAADAGITAYLVASSD